MRLEGRHKIANQELEGKKEQLAKCKDTMEELKKVLDQKTSELLRIEMAAEETSKVLNQAIGEKETSLSEREVLDKQNLDLKEDLKTAKKTRVETETELEETK